MSVIDLSVRLTTDKREFDGNKDSEESLVHVTGDNYLNDSNSIDLTIGSSVFHDGQHFAIPDSGYELKRGMGVVFETAQIVSLPTNVAGLVVGRGGLIYQGLFVSPGKINPCFAGPLRIGVFNGGSKKITLRQGERICSCLLLSRESSSIEGVTVEERSMSLPIRPTFGMIALRHISDKWHFIVSLLIALAALLVSIFKS